MISTWCNRPHGRSIRLPAVIRSHRLLAGGQFTQHPNFQCTYKHFGKLSVRHAESVDNGAIHSIWGFLYDDPFGNLYTITPLSPMGQTLQTPPPGTSNRLAISGVTYDNAGDVTTDNMGTQYSYDAEGRIATAGSWTYGYDGDGNRVLRSDGGSGGATYWYNAGGTLSDEQSVELAPGHPWAARLHCYFYFNGGVALQIGFSPCCWPSYYLIQDLLGSTRGSVGANSAVVDSDYYPFGEYVTQPSDTTLEQRFTGKERDAESGNDYFGARYYASSMGRFLSPDWSESPVPIPSASLSDPQSLNLYSYTRNNPLTRKDDDGHCDDDGGKHGSVWCFFHAIGFVESDTERSARIENERNALLGGTHPDGTPLTPAERKALHGAPQDQIDKLYGDVIYQQGLRKLDSQSRQAWMFPWTVAEINSNWHEGSFDSSEESLNYHFDTHGEEVGAESESEYLRKAEAFKSNLKGAQKSPVEGATEGVTRYTKNGKYIDLASDGRIVSFGKQ